LKEEKVLNNSFDGGVGKGNKFRVFLIVRVFRKKIKRVKKKPQQTQGTLYIIIMVQDVYK